MDRKEAIKNYKNTPTPVGVFRIRNNRDGKSFIGSSANLPAMLNRQRFQLDHGAHANKQLQADWSAMGADSFTIESLDVLEMSFQGQFFRYLSGLTPLAGARSVTRSGGVPMTLSELAQLLAEVKPC